MVGCSLACDVCQVTINRLTRDLEGEREGAGRFWEREGQLRAEKASLEARLEEKTREADRLEKTLASVKQECNATVTEKVGLTRYVMVKADVWHGLYFMPLPCKDAMPVSFDQNCLLNFLTIFKQ